MKCPECNCDLIYGGSVSDVQVIGEGEEFKPKTRYKFYWCENKECKNYRKSLKYDELLKKWG
jgi:hypothetical protein